MARAAKAGGHLEMLATPADHLDRGRDRARGGQCVPALRLAELGQIAQALVKRGGKGGAPVVVVTWTAVGGRNQEPFLRMSKKDTRNCEGCHPKDLQGSVARRPAYAGIDVSARATLQSANMTGIS